MNQGEEIRHDMKDKVMEPSAGPSVRADKLCKVFRDFWFRAKVRAVNGFDCELYPGEVFGLLGPNGSGKTTIMKMIMGLLNPSGGSILTLGCSPRNVRAKSRIGYLPEESYLYPFLTARETLMFYAQLFGLGAGDGARRTEDLLRMVGLEHARNRPVGEFSKGMARRIGLAQALINDPDLIALDEPTSGLDPVGCRQVKDLIRTLAGRGKSIILSSHLLADVENICDRVAILCDGNVIVQGRVQDLLAQQDAYRLTFRSIPRDMLEKMLSILRRETGTEPAVDHPMLTLEQFFLEAVSSARTGPVPERTGVAPEGRVAEYLAAGARENGN